MRGHSSKIAGTQFSSLAFPPKLGEKKIVGAGEKFFSQVFHLLFSIQCQTKENPLFHPIFLPIFSTIFKIHPTKHSIRERERSDRAMEAVIAAKPRIKVAALCGSLRKGSYNRGLVRSGTFPFPAFFFSLFFFFGSWVLILCVFGYSNRAEQVHQWLGNRVHRHWTFAYAQHWLRRRGNFPNSRGSFPPED